MIVAMLFLALLSAGAVTVCLVQRKRLREKDARMNAVLSRHNVVDEESAPYELAAIDQLLYDRCCRYMTEQRPFLVESFSLQDLATAVYTNKNYLSKTINRFSGKNFRQYVNYYRVMYAMERFRENKGLRIMEMSELSGFHSITSFTQSFKRVMGETPSFWCARIRKKDKNKR